MGWVKRVGALGVGLSMIVACAASGDGSERTAFEEGDGGDASTTGTIVGDGSTTNPPPGTADDASTGTTDAAADAPIDVAPGGNPVGFPCAKPSDCQSGDCKNVLAGSSTSVCVKPCTAQADCPDNFFCDPSTPGATTGSCVPRSPAHCKTCSTNAECGALSETCGVADGDTVKACHVDCTIGGQAACPADYTCEATTLDGVAAKVCRPAGGLSCLDSLGGFCDRVATPQTCTRKNTAGTCVGQRTCLAASTRFSTCGAPAPVCKMTCSTTDPAGCTTSYCTEATSGPQNCGTCGNVCPGYGQTSANVACNQPTCSFSCKGEKYDVDDNKGNGCEVAETTTGNHGKNTAVDLGDHGCKDGDTLTFSGRIPSDSQVHDPAIDGFDAATGSAPDYFKVRGTGSAFCVNNIDYTLTVTGSSFKGCYTLSIETNKNTYSCNTDPTTGSCRINPSGSSQYDDDTTVSFVISKRNVAGCLAAQRDNPSYSVSGHF